MLTAAPAWSHLNWWADLISIAGLALALFGIRQAWRQAKRATTAAEAAERAVVATESRLRGRVLLALLVPQLHWISNELDFAIEAEDAGHAQRQLKNWRQIAGNVRGMLNVGDPTADKDEYDLLNLLQESVLLARIAGQAIARSADAPLAKHCTRARSSINKVCDEFSMWVGEIVTRTGEERA
jgi:hypothetical protein